MRILLLSTCVGISLSTMLPHVRAELEWGTECIGESGIFDSVVNQGELVDVIEIPAGATDGSIELISNQDMDLRLVDIDNDVEIVGWPYGRLNWHSPDCAVYLGVEYCYSGYNGINGSYGHETIDFIGTQEVRTEVRVYGYQEGNAHVDYAWESDPCCVTSPGSGSVEVAVPNQDEVQVGSIPMGETNVTLDLDSPGDADFRLIDGIDDTVIVGWPDGLLSGPSAACTVYHAVQYCYSGYNGIGGELGRERIVINGTTNRPLLINVFGYQAASAVVTATSDGGPILAQCVDQDRDGDIDQTDFGYAQACLSGVDIAFAAGCLSSDVDGDSDVDDSDLLILLDCMAGTNQPFDPACTE